KEAARSSSSATSFSLRRMSAILIAVGYESFVDCDMFKSSCGSAVSELAVRLGDLVAALGVALQLEGDVREHLVGVHVGGGAGAALVPVGAELVLVLAVPHGLAGLLDHGQLLFRHGPDVGVGPRRCELHDGPGLPVARV